MESKIHPIIELIGKTLQEKEISDFKAAQLAGINRSTVGRILSGQSSPSLDNLEALSKVAGIKLTAKKTK